MLKRFNTKFLTQFFIQTKLYKIGFRTNDLCSFCKSQSESLNHLFFHCPYSKQFWNDLEIYWCSISSKRVRLSLQNVLVGIIAENTDPLHLLLNYFIMIGKLFLWNCRNNQILPNIHRFRAKNVLKYETEKINSRKDFFRKKMDTVSLSFLTHCSCHLATFLYCICNVYCYLSFSLIS